MIFPSPWPQNSQKYLHAWFGSKNKRIILRLGRIIPCKQKGGCVMEDRRYLLLGKPRQTDCLLMDALEWCVLICRALRILVLPRSFSRTGCLLVIWLIFVCFVGRNFYRYYETCKGGSPTDDDECVCVKYWQMTMKEWMDNYWTWQWNSEVVVIHLDGIRRAMKRKRAIPYLFPPGLCVLKCK